MAYTLIETVTVGSGGAASIEFTGIPQEAGADLVIVCSMRVVDNDNGKILFNGDTSTAYTTTRLLGTGSAVSSTVSTSESLFFMGLTDQNYTANTFGSAEILISNYTSSTNKSVSINAVTENNATFARQELGAGVYTTSSPITSLTLKANTTNTLEHSTASLYLVTTADATGATGGAAFPKATGGSISLAGGYWYHTFTSSGTFTPTETLTNTEWVCVAGGGGGGGGYSGGGGGAGGLRSSGSGGFTGGGGTLESTATFNNGVGYTVIIGAGGAAFKGEDQNGFYGNTSSMAYDGGNISSTRGGAGAGQTKAGLPGGSGGGSGDGYSSGGSGTANQGFAGGGAGGVQAGGGGGGAGAVGESATQYSRGFRGGAGVRWASNAATLAGGGGGGGSSYIGYGGSGGGGAGGRQNPAFQAQAGTAGTGSGGGGAGTWDMFSGAGAGGVVIVRYAA